MKEKDIKKQIKLLEDELIQKKATLKSVSNDVRMLTEEEKKLKNKLRTFANKDFLTNHCVMRYLERVYNFSFEDTKKEILSIEGLQSAILIGAKEFKKDGRVFIIQDGKIVTIY